MCVLSCLRCVGGSFRGLFACVVSWVEILKGQDYDRLVLLYMYQDLNLGQDTRGKQIGHTQHSEKESHTVSQYV